MSLHGEIMNITCEGETLDWANTREAYMYGHRDARHAAAELAIASDARIAELERQLAAIKALEPVGEVRWAGNVADGIKEVRWVDHIAPPVGSQLYTAPPQASQPAQQGEAAAWSVHHNGEYCGNVFTERRYAESFKQRMDTSWPNEKRDVVPFYTAPQPAQPQQKPTSIRERWNIERDGADLLVCFNQHDKGEKCEYQRFVPAPQPAQQPAQQGEPGAWLPMSTAPKDGTMLRLLVDFSAHALEDTQGSCPTIGANNFDHDERNVWLFVGWDWSHDMFTQGAGTPKGWLPLLDTQPAQQPLTDEQIQDLLGIGNPTEEECRLIRLGWEAANGIGGEKP